MKRMVLAFSLILLIGSVAPAVYAEARLFEYSFNFDGAISQTPAGLDLGAFDTVAGLGTITMTVSGEGVHYFAGFFDHDIDEAANTFFNEFGLQAGSAASGMTWEIDEPEQIFGDIYSNFEAGALDGSIGVTSNNPDDVSMAIGWDFSLTSSEKATITFMFSQEAPVSGFYLQQSDDESQESIYFTSTLNKRDDGTPVPEPGMLVLLITGLGAVAAAGFRKPAR